MEVTTSAQFGCGAGIENTNAVWPDIWPKALSIDERFLKIPHETLSLIEATIKEATATGAGAQRTATKLRPVFESVGLRRKDALALAAKATNLTYDAISNGSLSNIKLITTKGEESIEDFVAKARRGK